MTIKGTLKKIFAKPAPSEKPLSFMDTHALLFHIPLSLGMCFIIEWMSRHSFAAAGSFVVHHPVPYLYNSYLIFVFYSLCFLTKRQSFVRYLVSAFFVTMGIANGIILLNRVTPFGFSDIGMIGDLLTMQNTNYFTKGEAAACIIAIAVYALLMVRKFFSCKRIPAKVSYKIRYILIIAAFATLPLITKGLQGARALDSYFGNLARGYLDNGYLYGFSMSAFGRGMTQPSRYDEDHVSYITKADREYNEKYKTDFNSETGPNVIVMLLESYFDPTECSFLDMSEDPIPYFHELEDTYSTGHLTVPVVGAGTCNTEFEVLTGMSCRFFGPGEYPQKTILKKTDCESFAADLNTVGYGSHVVHNNGGNFYSRANAFSQMGFDSFTCKEMLDITEYNPQGAWPMDDILTQATADALDTTPGSDFCYTITVATHGDYPATKIFEDPAIKVTAKGKDEATRNKWEYYVNMLHEEDSFLRSYINMLSERDEPTLFIAFGDHLPTMGLEANEVRTGDLYKTKYITWNNFGMEKKDRDLTSYQLVSAYLDRLGFHDGTMLSYNQRMMADGIPVTSRAYSQNLELLQYDLLYGKRYAYGANRDPYPASMIEMGVKDVLLDRAFLFDGYLHLYGDNFSKWSRVYVNGKKVQTGYKSGQCLVIPADAVKNGDIIHVCQVGSSDTIFRTSNDLVYIDHTGAAGAAAPTEGAEASEPSE